MWCAFREELLADSLKDCSAGRLLAQQELYCVQSCHLYTSSRAPICEGRTAAANIPRQKLPVSHACPSGLQGEKGWTVAALQAGARECGLSPAAAALVSDNEAGLVQVSRERQGCMCVLRLLV